MLTQNIAGVRPFSTRHHIHAKASYVRMCMPGVLRQNIVAVDCAALDMAIVTQIGPGANRSIQAITHSASQPDWPETLSCDV